MKAAALLKQLRDSKVEVELAEQEGGLRIRAKTGILTGEMLDELREQKADLVRHLRSHIRPREPKEIVIRCLPYDRLSHDMADASNPGDIAGVLVEANRSWQDGKISEAEWQRLLDLAMDLQYAVGEAQGTQIGRE